MKHWKRMLCSAVLVAACLPAHAQNHFKVPFDFTAGTKKFTAGEYIVTQTLPDQGGVWTITGRVVAGSKAIDTRVAQSEFVQIAATKRK